MKKTRDKVLTIHKSQVTKGQLTVFTLRNKKQRKDEGLHANGGHDQTIGLHLAVVPALEMQFRSNSI